MRWWVVLTAIVLATTMPASVSAQTVAGALSCQGLTLQNSLPLYQLASRFGPSGLSPAGFAPLSQPFATNPNEYALWGYPQTAYYSSYVNPAYAQARPNLYPSGYPQASVYPGLYPFEVPPVPAVDPNPALSSAAILYMLQSDGTFDQLTSGERANFLLQLAALQQSEIGQRIAQAGLQQNAQASVINMRRVPFDMSVAYQSNARDWFQSYILYATAVQNLVSQNCNTSTGTLGGPFGGGLGSLTGGVGAGLPGTTGTAGLPAAGTPVGIQNLQAFCALNTSFNGGLCSGFR